jgi:rfaE bifunctional protein nucleotidyltransferase chain/domain
MSKIFDLTNLVSVRSRYRQEGKAVVFTNGCFDLLHSGHVFLLSDAKQQGDVLLVAVNSDASVRRLKGRGRPIFPLDERLEILEALESVDLLVSFEEDTPLNLIRELQPDVLVKGGDWSPDEVVGRSEVESGGGKVVIVPYRPGLSSTNIIEKITALKKK